jgi:hypothetical protein
MGMKKWAAAALFCAIGGTEPRAVIYTTFSDGTGYDSGNDRQIGARHCAASP